MTSSSYADSIYVKSRYVDRALDASGCMDPSTDFSFAMLDMQNSGFKTDYATLRPIDDLMACYLGPGDSDAGIYNAEFLERITHDFPQYKHVVAATNPYDSKCIKDAYNEITNSHKQDRTARRLTSDKNSVGSRMAEGRLVSVFCGSYDEQHTLRVILKANNTSHDASSVPKASLKSSSSSHSTNALWHGDSDSEYDDRRLIKRFKDGSRDTPKPAFPARTARNDSEHVPPLCLDDASSPESYSIETPNLSPITTPLAVKETETEIPDILDLNSSPGTSKDPVSTPGYNIVSSELLVASWGSSMGKFCHPMPGGYECSCGHRTVTMGDMTRHWQSKRHSEAAFGCKACGKVYTREDALKRHVRRNDDCARKVRRIGMA